jgi:hypothetical protein
MAIGALLGIIASRIMVQGIETYWVVPVAALVSGVAAGLPDVLDSEQAAGRAPLGISWNGIKRDARRKRKSASDGLLLIPRVILAVVVDIIAKATPHRGLTHWLSTWFVLSLLFWAAALWFHWPMALPLGFALGYISHLLADGLTFSGVPFFGPLLNDSLHLAPKPLRFRFDSPVQWLVVIALCGAAALVWREALTQLVNLFR